MSRRSGLGTPWPSEVCGPRRLRSANRIICKQVWLHQMCAVRHLVTGDLRSPATGSPYLQYSVYVIYLAFGEDGEHDAALHPDGDDNHHDGA